MARRGRPALSRTVRAGSRGFEDAIKAAMEEMCQEAEEQSIRNSTKAGERCIELLRTRSRRSSASGRHYADGFVADVRISRYGHSVTIHNRYKPGLTHLLEKGHDVIVRGKRCGRAAGDGVMKKSADEVGGILYEGYN